MANRILDAYVVTHRATPAGAELRIVVRTESLTSATQIRGRLMGPRSPYASTVEIAYPFREIARTDHILLRVLIPEPNWWDPATPLLYEGPLELWEGDERCEQITLRHGIRTVQLTPQGLRVNGKLTRLNGVIAETLTEQDARRWHAEGVNMILLPAHDEGMSLWTLSDRFGLFVLGRIDDAHQWPRWALASQRHASFLGCVLTANLKPGPREARIGAGLLGVESSPARAAPAGRCDFVLLEDRQEWKILAPSTINVGSAEDLPIAEAALFGKLRRFEDVTSIAKSEESA